MRRSKPGASTELVASGLLRWDFVPPRNDGNMLYYQTNFFPYSKLSSSRECRKDRQCYVSSCGPHKQVGAICQNPRIKTGTAP